MILPVNDHYRLASDSRCWMLEEEQTRKRNGQTVTEWTAIRWYMTLASAVDGFAEFSLRTSEAKTLADALAEVKRIGATLETLCSELGGPARGIRAGVQS